MEIENRRTETLERDVPRLTSSSESIQSERHSNEDSFFNDDSRGIYGVFDGVGGREGGEVASKKVNLCVQDLLKRMPQNMGLNETASYISKAMRYANNMLLESQIMNPHFGEMATTASVIKVLNTPEGHRKVIMANVGDSRVYTYRKRERPPLVLQSFDDGPVRAAYENDPRKAYQIQEALDNCDDPERLNPEMKYLYRNRNRVFNVMGRKNMDPRISAFDVKKGDLVIITSDGVHDNLTRKQIEKIISRYDPKVLSKALCGFAYNDRSKRHKDDDITAVVVEVQ